MYVLRDDIEDADEGIRICVDENEKTYQEYQENVDQSELFNWLWYDHHSSYYFICQELNRAAIQSHIVEHLITEIISQSRARRYGNNQQYKVDKKPDCSQDPLIENVLYSKISTKC